MMTDAAGTELKQSWDRIAQRLKAELGDDLYSSWFARMEPEECVRRPARGFRPDPVPAELDRDTLRSRLHKVSEAELGQLDDVHVRCAPAACRSVPPTSPSGASCASDAPNPQPDDARTTSAPCSSRRRARLAARSEPDLRELHHRRLEPARPCRGVARRRSAAGPAGQLQSAVRPFRRRARQDASAQCHRLAHPRAPSRPQGAVHHRRALHVSFHRRAQAARHDRLQGLLPVDRRACSSTTSSSCRASRCSRNSATPSIRWWTPSARS